MSAAHAYLRMARNRNNLTILTKAHVKRVVFDANKRATGVIVLRDTCVFLFSGAHVIIRGKEEMAVSKKEVILSGGAIGSPHILLLSGVGPKGKHRTTTIFPNLENFVMFRSFS